MSDRFTAAQGRKAVRRATAEELGTVSRLALDSAHQDEEQECDPLH